MTFEEKLVELKKDFESKIEELKAEYKEEKEKPKEWIPEDGEKYWFVTDDCRVLNKNWGEWCYDSRKLLIGNVFKTQEEAEFEMTRLEIIAEMKKYSKPFNHYEDNYFICYQCKSHKICMTNYSLFQSNEIYFESEEIIRKVIDEIGEDNIKKYYLRVE